MNLITYKADSGVSHRGTLQAPVAEESDVKSNSRVKGGQGEVSGLNTIFRSSRISIHSILILNIATD